MNKKNAGTPRSPVLKKNTNGNIIIPYAIREGAQHGRIFKRS